MRRGQREAARGVNGVAGPRGEQERLHFLQQSAAQFACGGREGARRESRRGARRHRLKARSSTQQARLATCMHGSTPWRRTPSVSCDKQALSSRGGERERERERKCARGSVQAPRSLIDEAPTHDALICVHTHSQHALSRQARTKQTSVTLLKIMVTGGRTQ